MRLREHRVPDSRVPVEDRWELECSGRSRRGGPDDGRRSAGLGLRNTRRMGLRSDAEQPQRGRNRAGGRDRDCHHFQKPAEIDSQVLRPPADKYIRK
jgi:hypothetical protein